MSPEDPYEGQKFKSFDVLKKYLEEYGRRNFVKFWIRSSHTINSIKSKSAKKMNPDLKYVCMKFACIFGGEKIRCRGTGIRKSTTYRNLGCPCMINAVVGEDGNHVRLETVVLEHNHGLCKSLYESIKKTRKMRTLQSDARVVNRSSVLKRNATRDNCDASEAATTTTTTGDANGGKMAERANEASEEGGGASRGGSDDDFHDYLRGIQHKYGSNIKIIVVRRDESDGEAAAAEAEPDVGSREDSPKTTDERLGGVERWRRSQVCRLCLSTSNKLSPIFKPSLPVESTILSFKIMSCASIEIRSDDDLPSSICSACEEILDIAYNFRIRCENSDSVLRKASLSDRFIDACVVSNGGYVYEEEGGGGGGVGGEGVKAEELPEEKGSEVGNWTEDAVKDEKETFPEAKATDLSNDAYDAFEEACPVCGSLFGSYSDVLSHMKDHVDVENFLLTCNLCGAIFTTVKALLEHVDEHLADVKTEDWTEDGVVGRGSRCELRFRTDDDDKLRGESHAAGGDEEEEEAAAAASSLPAESKADKANNSGSYLCNVCGKILKSKDRFQSHRNMHEGLRPHICLKCGRGFADRKNMHQHYDIVHLRKAKHECPICHKMFYAPTKMKSHITMHYDVKPFSCDVCGKTFRLKMNMIKHKKTHSNERPHKCDKCSAAFIDKNLLTRHSYVHGGIRPYVCHFCGHRFTVKFNLKKHMVSGRCGAKRESKDVAPSAPSGEEYARSGGDGVDGDDDDDDDWGEMSQNDETLPRVDVKCETNDSSELSRESIAMNVLPDYEEKN